MRDLRLEENWHGRGALKWEKRKKKFRPLTTENKMIKEDYIDEF